MSKTLKIITISVLMVCLSILFLMFIFNLFYPRKYSLYVEKYSLEYNLNQNLVYSVINAESSFDKNAKSKTGAIGLMQIMPQTAQFIAEKLQEEFNPINLFDAETNIKYGCFYLNYLFNKFNSKNEVLSAYNAGETITRTWINQNDGILIVQYPETQNYVNKINNQIKVYAFLTKYL